MLQISSNGSEALDDVTDVQLGNGTTATVSFSRRPDLELSENALMEALMRYCQARRVPLPQRGVKSLRRDEHGLSLVIRLADAPFATQLASNAG